MNYKKATVALTRLTQTMQSLADRAENTTGSETGLAPKPDDEKP